MRRLTACRDTGKTPAGGDVAAVARWLDVCLEPLQLGLWDVAA